MSLLVRATATVDSGYALLLVTSALFALGMGLCIAPATASIMGAVPKERAGAGSAINDTTRQVGGALGVAVLGSIGAALFRIVDARPARCARRRPGRQLDRRRARRRPRSCPAAQAAPIIDAARHAFIDAADLTCVVAAVVTFAGALGALRFLPAARPVEPTAARRRRRSPSRVDLDRPAGPTSVRRSRSVDRSDRLTGTDDVRPTRTTRTDPADRARPDPP